MNIFQKLTYGYSMLADGSFADVSGQDFVDHLSIGAPGWVGAWVAAVAPLLLLGSRLHGHLGLHPCMGQV